MLPASSIMVTLSLDLENNIDVDRFDIEESFESLDVHKTGRLAYDRGKSMDMKHRCGIFPISQSSQTFSSLYAIVRIGILGKL